MNTGTCGTCEQVVPLTRKGHLAHHGTPTTFDFPEAFHGGCCLNSGELPAGVLPVGSYTPVATATA